MRVHQGPEGDVRLKLSATRPHLRIAALLALSVLSARHGLAAQSATKILEGKGIAIEYPPEWAGVAERVHPWLCKRLESFRDWRPEDDVLRIHRKQDEIVKVISGQLGVTPPGGGKSLAMEKFLRQMIRLMGKAASAIPNPKRIRLWKRQGLVAYLDGGGQLPGYQYDRATNKVSFGVNLISGSSGRVTRPGVVPIVLTESAEDRLVAEAQMRVDRLLIGVQAMVPGLAATSLGSTARIGVREDLDIRLPNVRWFVEGASNYVAWVLVRRYLGEGKAKEFLATLDVMAYADAIGQVDVHSWLAEGATSAGKQASQKRLQSARMAFATHEVMRLVARHGQGTLPKVFAELKKVSDRARSTRKDEEPDEALEWAVLDAITKVTGEDMRKRLMPQKKDG